MPQVAPILGNIALNLAAGVALSVLSSAFTSSATSTPVTTSRGMSFEMVVGEEQPVRAVMGLGRARGQLIYHNEYGTDNEYLQFVILVGHGEHDGLDTVLVDEKAVTLSGSNADPKGRSVDEYTVSGTPYLWVKYYTGAAGQAADAELVATANPAGRWTVNHKLTGCAYMIVTLRYNANLFGNTVPKFGSVWRGLKLYDWRQPGAIWGDPSTYVFSKNPAVIAYNWRRGIWVNGVRVLGLGFGAAANDTGYFTSAANRCDETFFDPETGRTITIYEYGREVSDDEDRLDVLKELEAAWCGSSFKRGGAYAPLPAQQLVSVMTLTDADMLQRKDGRPYPSQLDRKGQVSTKKTLWHGQFVSADNGWASSPYEPRKDAALASIIGGDRAIQLNQPYEHDQVRAQLRAEIALRRQLYAATRVEHFGPKALVLEPGDPITRDCGWGQMVMIVERTDKVLIDGKVVGVKLTLSQWDNSIVPASGESFVTIPTGPGAGPADPTRTIAVSGLAVVPYQRQGGGAVHPCGKASWTPITDPNVDQVMIRVWPDAGTEADDRQDFFASARLQSVKVFGPLSPSTLYRYKAIPLRSDGRATVWTNEGTFTTGEEVIPIADGSITPDMLAQELSNERGILTGSGDGTLSGRINEILKRIEEQAAAALDAQLTAKTRTTLLEARNKSTSAAVVREATVRADEDAALAALIDQVAVEIADVTADGFIKMEAQIDEGASTAEILMKVKATVAAAFSEAALRLKASSDGQGGSISEVLIMADRLIFLSSAGGVTVIPFEIDGGQVYLKTAHIRDLASANIDVAELIASQAFVDNLSVTSAQIEDGAITSAKIGNLEVGTSNLDFGSVTGNGRVSYNNRPTADDTWHTLVSFNVSPSSLTSFLRLQVSLSLSQNDPNFQSTLEFQLWRSAGTGQQLFYKSISAIDTSTPVTSSDDKFIIDTTGLPAGTFSYQLQAKVTNNTTGEDTLNVNATLDTVYWKR